MMRTLISLFVLVTAVACYDDSDEDTTNQTATEVDVGMSDEDGTSEESGDTVNDNAATPGDGDSTIDAPSSSEAGTNGTGTSIRPNGPSDQPAGLSGAFASPDPGPVPGCSGTSFSAMRGWMVDQDGLAVEGALAQLCLDGAGDGPTTCLQPVRTESDGFFSITIPASNRCAEGGVMRAVLVDPERPPHSAMYCHLPLDTLSGSTQLTMTDPLRLYATGTPVDKPELGDDRASRTVDLGEGLTVDVVPYDIFGSEVSEDYAALSAKAVSPDSPGLCFLEGNENLDGLYAMAPDLPVLGEGVQVRIANTQGLDAGAAVDFFILGGIDCALPDGKAPEGDWVSIGAGQVSADGSTIEAGIALPCLTWLGYRAQ